MKKQRRRRSTTERSLASPAPPFLPPQRDVRYTESPRGHSHCGPAGTNKWNPPSPTATGEQYTLKVTNLSPDVTQEEMELVCGSYSDYQSLKVNDGGYAYVNFLSQKGAERAMECLRKVEFNGQCPTVKLHKKQPTIQSQPHSHYGQTSSIPPYRPFTSHSPAPTVSLPQLQAQQVETTTLKVTLHGGHDITGEAIEEYFGQFGKVCGTPAIIQGKPDYAYVNFKTSHEAKAACNPSKVQFDGIVMIIKLSNKAPASTSSKLVTFEDNSLVNVITTCKLHELEDRLSSAVTAKSSKDSKGVRISGDKDKVDEAESIVRSYMKHLQGQIISESMYLHCQFIPLLKDPQVFQTIEQQLGVEFNVILPNGSTKSLATFSNTISSLMSSGSSPFKIESVSEYVSDIGAVSWKFFDDHEFTFMSAADSAEIEKRYQKYLRSQTPSSYIRGGWKYRYDFDKMVQVNTITNKQRIIDSLSLCLSCHGLEKDVRASTASLHEKLEGMIIKETLEGCSANIAKPIIKLARLFCIKVDPLLDDKILFSGDRDYITKVSLALEKKRLEEKVKQDKLPRPLEWESQTSDIELKNITPSSSEWVKVKSAVKKTMTEAKIVQIERIQNKYLYDKYALCKKRMHKKNNGQVNEKWLFHGSRGVSPERIYKSEHGFDFRYGGQGLWGKGAYFAVNASYSGGSYAFNSPQGRQIFLAFVLTGDSKAMGSDKSLVTPPKKEDGSGDYDSVNGLSGSSQVYIVYDHDKSYPAYLITFQ
ncbi:PREDICTED: uncharacterized protein LOC105313219 [Amphimedon queenslandica]|uniref:Poly [ADP-ribose] polymerase n=1 Tax=Amphimedon queenslandica TaxID=400682 RepID=A0A1X7ULQ3_AMPQE|nr:PREDICTED: uncharacterized protein LOC105313219 [Amphimedon queenslandica]|eukprot:XP_011404758.1 PREDICTED: uncharacterized protein LOC105313219 [Amphimedon queenslandica]